MATKKETSYKKGKEFEQEFAKFMKNKLEYDKVKLRKQVSGKHNIKGAEADIIGVEHNPKSERLRDASIYLIFIALIGFGLIIGEVISTDWVGVCVVCELGAFFYHAISRKLGDKYTWVECKNQKHNVNLTLVRDLYNKVKDNNQSKDRRFKIHKIFFVARKGFVNVAEDYAHEHEIACFIQKGKLFIPLKQWD